MVAYSFKNSARSGLQCDADAESLSPQGGTTLDPTAGSDAPDLSLAGRAQCRMRVRETRVRVHHLHMHN